MQHSRGKTWTIRRVVKHASICLLLGAIVNVAVAWGFAWFIVPSKDAWQNKEVHNRVSGRHTPMWILMYWEGHGSIRLNAMPWNPSTARVAETKDWYFEDGIPPYWSMAKKQPSQSHVDNHPTIVEIANGWPFYSLKMYFDYENIVLFKETNFIRTRGGMALRPPDPSANEWLYAEGLPLTPIWWGFIQNRPVATSTRCIQIQAMATQPAQAA